LQQDKGKNPPLVLASHIPALDGVRGLAILLVLAHHLLAANTAVTGSTFLNVITLVRTGGWMGVDLFFVLSGFLITGILFDSLGGRAYFRTFYIRRFLRIFPLYYGALFFLLLLSVLLSLHWNGYELVYLAYLQNLPPWSFHIPSLNIYGYTGHFWSLAVEEQFYLIWPLIVFLVRDRRRLLVTALALVPIAPALRIWTVLHGLPHPLTYQFTLCRTDSLLLGACLALAIRGPRPYTLLRIAPVAAAVCFVGTTALALRHHPWNLSEEPNTFLKGVGFTLLAISFAALIASVLRSGSLIERLFRNAAMRWLGRYSYGIYVFHMIVLAAVGFGPRLWLDARFHSKVAGIAGEALLCLTITLALAWISFNFYEKPFLRLKRRFDYGDERKKNGVLKSAI
jgi:peptidoglycan/LPS O-acetylase OafA/YrhL